MDDFVRTMHTKSGLLPEIAASTMTLADAGSRRRSTYVKSPRARSRRPRRCAATRSASTAASSTATSPSSTRYVHYRSIDVSTLKELCRRWYPAVYKHRPSKTETHRALADILESIAELAYYREAILVPPPGT